MRLSMKNYAERIALILSLGTKIIVLKEACIMLKQNFTFITIKIFCKT